MRASQYPHLLLTRDVGKSITFLPKEGKVLVFPVADTTPPKPKVMRPEDLPLILPPPHPRTRKS